MKIGFEGSSKIMLYDVFLGDGGENQTLTWDSEESYGW